MSNQTKKWYSFIPNLFTSSNLMCGVVATYFSLNGKIQVAFILIIVAAFFDFIDGLTARALKVNGELGKQLDSLADVISFGMVPGAMIFWLQTTFIPGFNLSSHLSPLQLLTLLTPALIPLFSALRLAKFNIDERQHDEFYGLPTPANALLIASLTWTLTYKHESFLSFLNNPYLIAIITLLFSFLLVSEVRLFALKFSDYTWKTNKLKFIFILFSLIILIFTGITGITAIILLYIILSVFYNLFKKK